MELTLKGSIPAGAAANVYEGTTEFVLPAGKSLKIEINPQGEEVLNITAGAAAETIALVVTRRVPV